MRSSAAHSRQTTSKAEPLLRTFCVMSSGATGYQMCPLRGVRHLDERRQNLGHLPIRADLDSFDPVPAATIRPALDLDLAFMYDHLLVKREDDGAPTSKKGLDGICRK